MPRCVGRGGGGGGGVRMDPNAISKTVSSMNLQFCRILETFIKVSEMLRLFYNVFTWLP